MKILRSLGLVGLALAVLVAAAFVLQPKTEGRLNATFDTSAFEEGVQRWFVTSEARFDDITPDTQKRVIWAGAPEVRTPLSILYVHGFSATSEEIRPVPDQLARALGANLVYTRLQGHGRGSDAMAEATVAGWMADMAEALAAAKAVGARVIVIGTSTGGTLVASAAVSPEHMEHVAGVVLISPNFGVNNPQAGLLTWPFAQIWAPWIAGDYIGFQPRNDRQATYWTTRYPTRAAIPMGHLVKSVANLDYSDVEVPALFWYSRDDRVVRADVTDGIAAAWGQTVGTSVTVVHPTLGPGDDPSAHVIAGDTVSPGQTAATVAGLLDWIVGL